MKKNIKLKNNFSPALAFKPNSDLFLWKVSAFPALSYIPMPAFARDKKHAWPNSEILFIDGSVYWWSNWDAVLKRGATCVSSFIGRRDDFSKAYYKKYSTVVQKLEAQFKKLDKIDFKALDRKKLRPLWIDFFKVYVKDFWPIVIYPEMVAYGASAMLENEIKRQKIKIKPELISELVNFTQRSYAAEEEIQLLKIILETDKSIQARKIADHAYNFRWLLNGYHGVTPTGISFFQKRIKEIKSAGNIKARLLALEEYTRRSEKIFSKLINTYKLSKKIVRLARIAQHASFLQDDRKRLHLTATDYIIKLYRALALNLNIDLTSALCILDKEFDLVFRSPQSLEKMKTRSQTWRARFTREKINFYSSGVKEVNNILEEYRRQATGDKIQGSVAYAGKVTGIVQIIKTNKELNNFSKGKILVTVMTSPDYIRAMKLSKAIVTDEGGLVCHAAIVAREMKKPCIVGTKNATKILHNGDLVDVDADKGTVKIVKKA